MLHPFRNQWHSNGDVGEAWASLSLLSRQKIPNTKSLNLCLSFKLFTGKAAVLKDYYN